MLTGISATIMTIALITGAPTSDSIKQSKVPVIAITAEGTSPRMASTTAARMTAAISKASVIPAKWAKFADCVAERESHHNPRALNKSSGAAGRWQYLPGWRHGLPYMVAGLLVRNGYPKSKANRLVRILQAAPINTWRAHYQDIGFIATVTAPNGMGWRHWSLAGSPCNALVPN